MELIKIIDEDYHSLWMFCWVTCDIQSVRLSDTDIQELRSKRSDLFNIVMWRHEIIHVLSQNFI